MKRFVSVWLHHLETDWFVLRQPTLLDVPFVLISSIHGRLIVTAANNLAEKQGIKKGMGVADARIINPALQVLNNVPELNNKLLCKLAEWCIRFTPCVGVDGPDGLMLDASGCAHLWGGDVEYLTTIVKRLNDRGYKVRVGMADTIGAAWAIARYGNMSPVIEINKQYEALQQLPPASLRIEHNIIEQCYKLGLHQLKDFLSMPRSALRRRFGQAFLQKLDQDLCNEQEFIQPIKTRELYQERLPCLEPIVTLTGIEIALQQLLSTLCYRLDKEQMGIRVVRLQCFRVDDKMMQVEIGTNRPSRNVKHLIKLFESKLSTIEPALGIELFVLYAVKVERHSAAQEKIWEQKGGLSDTGLSELLDRFAMRFGNNCFYRYLPDEHYWPERSFKQAISLEDKPVTSWRTDQPRPLHLFTKPQPVEVTAPIPDYPPILFRYMGKLHKIVKADGPERIEQEWWLQQGQYRDYYSVEDEAGQRFWLFRSGPYDAAKTYGWFLHGFFA